ncbi:hypothetical protein ACOMHN_043915 [Nucella lapillus]
MNTTPAPRRQSIIVDGAGASPSAAATAAASGNVHYSGIGGGRPSLLITPASQQGRRPSMVNPNAAAPVVIPSKTYENSYKTSPEKPFRAEAAKRVLREVMDEMLEGRHYDKEACKQLASSLADAIKKRVKELGHPRYKLVTHVAIGQAENTTLSFASRCVWNDSFDSFVEYTYKNGSLYAVGLVHALYCD